MDDINLEEIKNRIQILQEKKANLLKEKQGIEESTILKRYFELNNELIDLDKEIKKKKKEEAIVRYSLCDHGLLFLESYCFRRKKYHPKFKCLGCGKRIIGALNKNQIVINENYTEFIEGAYLGDLKDYKKLCKLYSEFKEQGLETLQTAVLLEGYLHEKYHETKSVLKLVRK